MDKFSTEKGNFKTDMGIDANDYPSEYILYVTAKIQMDILKSLTDANDKLTSIKGSIDKVATRP